MQFVNTCLGHCRFRISSLLRISNFVLRIFLGRSAVPYWTMVQ
jgi:hypothetical protein